MKKTLLVLIGVILLITSILIAGYPFISDFVNDSVAKTSVLQYLDSAQDTNDEELEEKLEAAKKYNESLVGSVTVSDPFEKDSQLNKAAEEILKLNGTEAIGAIEIPSIGINLPIYYGTSDLVLAKGAGLLPNTSIPVGGVGTHSVITGHTGYSAIRLFTDLHQLKEGDKFYIKIFGETLAYEVDNIAVVTPFETDLLQISPDKDYVTLVTCTPFGVNSHRLFVRGVRTQYVEHEEEEVINKSESTWINEYKIALMWGAAVMVAILAFYALIRLIIFLIGKRKKNEKQDH